MLSNYIQRLFIYSLRFTSSMHTTRSVIANGIAGKTKQSRRLRQTTEASEDEQTFPFNMTSMRILQVPLGATTGRRTLQQTKEN